MGEARIMGFGLNSGDLDRAVEFYTEVLGLTAQHKLETPEVTEVILQYDDDMSQPRLMLVDGTGNGAVASGWGRGVFVVDDAAAVCEKVRARGLPVTRDAAPVPGHPVSVAVIEDPDGNRVEIVEFHASA